MKTKLQDFNVRDLQDILTQFGKKHRIFHSEAQLQFELAWEIRKKVNCRVLLEVLTMEEPISNKIKRYYTDIVLEDNDYRVAIELKYKTAEFKGENDVVELLNHGAVDLGRYDFLWDVYRLELLQNPNKNSQVNVRKKCEKGFAILLTNEEKYWTKRWGSGPNITIDNQFRIGIDLQTPNKGRLYGNGQNLDWIKNPDGSYPTCIQNNKSRAHTIDLNQAYSYEWFDYCEMQGHNSKFKFTIIEIVNSLSANMPSCINENKQ